jgi:LPS sulfotransferase NodH
MSRFDYFVILAEMRTGSNFLEANLNLLEGVTCHGEAFNPSFIGFPKTEDLLGVTYEMREADPFLLLARIKESDGLGGFRLFHNHDQRIAEECLSDPRCAKIILSRNPVDSFVSWKIAQATGQWKLTNATHSKTKPVTFDFDEFEAHLLATESFQKHVQRRLQVSGQTAFYINYDDLRDVDAVNGIAAFLGVGARLDSINKKLKKQNPDPLEDKVTNFAEMQSALQSVDWFALWRAPQFEPQRGPAIPSYMAPARTGLLYVPLKSGPDRAIRDWFELLDRGKVLGKFTQRTLRDWFEAHVPHRSFAVLRHPVARAHAAFCERILCDDGGRFAEIRANLRRVHRLEIPDGVPDMTGKDGYDAAAHRAAFMGFLNFLRVNLAGQTSIRVDQGWASQHAILQGVAQFASPDAVLREEELAVALPRLATDLGHTEPPAYQPQPPRWQDWLTAVYDAEIEKAARLAYAKDYQFFGFKDWA